MPLGMPTHDEGTEALHELLTEFVSEEGVDARVVMEEPYGDNSQYQVDNFAEFSGERPLPTLAAEFEAGKKTHPRTRKNIRNRFERYRSRGFQRLVAGVPFVLDGGDDETLRDVAREYDAGILEADKRGEEVQFRPVEGMDSGTLARLAEFMSR